MLSQKGTKKCKRLKKQAKIQPMKKSFVIFSTSFFPNLAKIYHTSDTPTKIVKINSYFFNFQLSAFKHCADKGRYQNELKHTHVVAFHEIQALQIKLLAC